jgi:hypothetical protein
MRAITKLLPGAYHFLPMNPGSTWGKIEANPTDWTVTGQKNSRVVEIDHPAVLLLDQLPAYPT